MANDKCPLQRIYKDDSNYRQKVSIFLQYPAYFPGLYLILPKIEGEVEKFNPVILDYIQP